MTSNFDKWFTAQFGPPVFKTTDAAQATYNELRSLLYKVDQLEQKLERHELQQEQRRAALYAWQAKPTGAKGLVKARKR